MNDGILVSVWLKPLTMLGKNILDEHPEYDLNSIIKFICSPDVEAGEEYIIERYNQIDKTEHQLFAAPSETNILIKLIWPIRNAKCSDS